MDVAQWFLGSGGYEGQREQERGGGEGQSSREAEGAGTNRRDATARVSCLAAAITVWPVPPADPTDAPIQHKQLSLAIVVRAVRWDGGGGARLSLFGGLPVAVFPLHSLHACRRNHRGLAAVLTLCFSMCVCTRAFGFWPLSPSLLSSCCR
jgi:hypothetical protein